ncbi:MAG TPA: phosphotransferase [Pyrinomonadaceae bacterium]|jgi:tRNA A-37 threonylcarbamoyl transferase component Bud32|nr:phosphotransferase [Pyrinomonadaceae bacterium]
MSLTSPRINLASDPMLPQRDILLDASMVARLLGPQLGTSGPLVIDSCELLRTKYRFGDSLRVLHRIRVGCADFNVAARAFPEGRSERAYERALNEAVVCCAPLRAVVHSAEIGTVFWTFPNDRRLNGLRALENIPADLAQLFVPAWSNSRLVAYAPEKCATAQCLDEDSNVLAYVKVYEGDEGERIFGIYNALRRSLSSGSAAFELPRALAYSEKHRMLLLEKVEGVRLIDLHGPDGPGGYKRLGSALAALHCLPVPTGLRVFKRLEVKRIGRAAQIIGEARPDVKREALALASELAEGAESQTIAPVCLHGDVHPKNIILRGDSLTLIDLDQAAAGSPAADLGSLLASLSYNRLSGLLSRTRALELGDAFLVGYAAVRELPTAVRLSWHTAAALLAERALRAVNRIRPEGLARLPQLLAEATRILQTGGVR